MKILVIGAHGQIGRQLVQILQAKENCQVIAGLRSASQQEEYQQQNIMTAYVDLTKAQAQLEQVMQGVDVVVFAAGSGGKTGADATMMIDLDGAVKAINAAEKTNVSRFIMISSI
ncbi:MAG: NAD(P)H-binding protein, partial [Bombilactobacillus sp.]